MGSDATLAAGVAPGTTHGLHDHGSYGSYGSYPAGAPTQAMPPAYHDERRSPYGTMNTVPGLHGSPAQSERALRPPPPLPPPTNAPPGYGSFARPGSGGYGAPGSLGSIGSAGTAHGLHPAYPDAHFMGHPSSSGTVHDLHGGYAPQGGYSPPPSHMLGRGDEMAYSQPHPGQVVGKLTVRIIKAIKLKNTDLGVVADEPSEPFCVIRLGNQEHKTEVVRAVPDPRDRKLNPVFNSQHFEFLVPNEDDVLKVEIFNASQFYAHDTLGKVSLYLHEIVGTPGEIQMRTDPLLEDGKKTGEGKLQWEFYYVPPERMMMNVAPQSEASTHLTLPARPGDTRLEVASQAGFHPGQPVSIGDGPHHEVNQIAGFGSLVLKHPLKYNHQPGTLVKSLVAKDPAAIPFVDLKVQHKPPQHKVPLPDFRGYGPEAFARPPPEIEKAPVGELRKKQEYDSWACHLGQYNYDDKGPIYFPRDSKEDPVDRHAWKNDPFYHQLEDCDRSGAGGTGPSTSKDPFGKWLQRDAAANELYLEAGKCTKCGSVFMSDANFCRKCGQKREARELEAYRGMQNDKRVRQDRQQITNGLWKTDPFCDWLSPTGPAAGLQEGPMCEKILEAKRERRMMALPSIKDDIKRFEDHREYVAMDRIKVRPRLNQQKHNPDFLANAKAKGVYEAEHHAILWKDDAFYGWLPDHGGTAYHDASGNAAPIMHQPLENARLERLPSFSEDKFLGLKGRGLGVLKIWVKYAKHLQYDTNIKHLGRPSACVKLSCHDKDKKHDGLDDRDRGNWKDAQGHPKIIAAQKLTPTIENEENPVWNTGAFQFEVENISDTLTLNVIDLLGYETKDGHYDTNVLLGRVRMNVRELLDELDSRQRGRENLKQDLERTLEGVTHKHSRLGFTVSYVPYAREGQRQLADYPRHEMRPPSYSSQGHPQSASRQRDDSFSHGRDGSFSHGRHHNVAPSFQSHGSGHSFDTGYGKIHVAHVKVSNLAHGDNAQSNIVENMFEKVGMSQGNVYVVCRLNTQSVQRSKRTDSKAYKGGATVEWDTKWEFNVEPDDTTLEFSVHNDHMLSSGEIIGTLSMPIQDLFRIQTHELMPIADKLKDSHNHDTPVQLEVHLRSSPGNFS
jgi:hypothetical protein